jgi:16S rRNA processing protein RimM
VTESSGEWVTLARVVKTQGRRGEVAAELHTDVPDRFQVGMRLSGLLKDGTRRELVLEEFWPHKSWLVLKFVGIDSISDAEVFKGAEFQVPVAERAVLEPGWTYLSDLAGCTVYNAGSAIGKVADVQFGSGEAPLLVVRNQAGKEFLVPFAQAYLVETALDQKQIFMKLPPGLLELDAPLSAEEKERQKQQD